MENIAPGGVCEVWPEDDYLRLLYLLGARDSARLSVACPSVSRRLSSPVSQLRKVQAGESGSAEKLETEEALSSLESLLGEASRVAGEPRLQTVEDAREQLSQLEAAFHTEMRYVHGPDWEVRPGKLITKKGTWLKKTTKFSWEIPAGEKIYLPEGVAVPVLQIGRVTDASELKLHEWSSQHLRVWLKPNLVRQLEVRRDVWYVYFPHFEGEGNIIVAMADSWMKRSCQMSGELQPFELIYVPKGLPLYLQCPPEPVTEDWEKLRHGHVHQHRKLILAAPPLTMRRDKFDIFVGQPDDKTRTR